MICSALCLFYVLCQFVPNLESFGSSSQIKDTNIIYLKMAKDPCLNSPARENLGPII